MNSVYPKETLMSFFGKEGQDVPEESWADQRLRRLRERLIDPALDANPEITAALGRTAGQVGRGLGAGLDAIPGLPREGPPLRWGPEYSPPAMPLPAMTGGTEGKDYVAAGMEKAPTTAKEGSFIMNFKSAQAILDREAARCRLPDLSASAVGIVKRALSEKEEAKERLEDVRDQERRRVGLNTNKTLGKGSTKEAQLSSPRNLLDPQTEEASPPRDLLPRQAVDMDFRPNPNPEDDLDFQDPEAAWESGRGWTRGGPVVDAVNAPAEVQEAGAQERAQSVDDSTVTPDSASVGTPNAIKQAQAALARGAATRFGLPALLTQAVALAGITMGAEAIYNMANRAVRSVSQSSRYRKILEANPDLQQADSRKVVDRFRVLDNFGPTISEDPVVAGHWIRQTLEFPTVTPTVLKDVVDVETRMREAGHPLGGGKEVGKGILGHMSRGMNSPGFSFGSE